MPTYDYECKSCEHTFELFQSINEPVKKKCPRCKKNSLRRLFGTGAALLFRGSGFYQTDYRSESYKKGAEAEKKSTDGGASKSADGKAAAKSADSKPAETKPVESRADGASREASGSSRKKAVAASA